jgi:hypothetical protein
MSKLTGSVLTRTRRDTNEVQVCGNNGIITRYNEHVFMMFQVSVQT